MKSRDVERGQATFAFHLADDGRTDDAVKNAKMERKSGNKLMKN